MFTLNALPNWMTIMRIAITPLIAVLIWIDEPAYGYQLALALYTIASVTDYIDGYMARRLKVESPLGEMLDPIADKLLVAAVLLALASVTSSGWLFLAPALIILIREFMISGLREFLAKQNVSAPVTRLAKWKTTAQILALGFLMVTLSLILLAIAEYFRRRSVKYTNIESQNTTRSEETIF